MSGARQCSVVVDRKNRITFHVIATQRLTAQEARDAVRSFLATHKVRKGGTYRFFYVRPDQ